MTVKEHAIMTAVVLTVIMAFIFLGGCSAQAALPEVQHHESAMTLDQAHAACQEYLASEEKPCTVVQIDDEVCYAYQNLDGSSKTVQCFIEGDI